MIKIENDLNSSLWNEQLEWIKDITENCAKQKIGFYFLCTQYLVIIPKWTVGAKFSIKSQHYLIA